MYGIILRIINDEEDAQNLLQDCFIKVWKHINSFNNSEGRLATWLISIARNTAIAYRNSNHYTTKYQQVEIEKMEHMFDKDDKEIAAVSLRTKFSLT